MTLSFSTRLMRRLALAGFAALVFPISLYGQMGNDNPTGVSGVFNGNVTTAGSYDPYTGNATRSITDITVAGAVGAYPLAFTRTMNSRYTPGVGTLEMGAAGSWRHSYQWSMDPLVYRSSNPQDRWTFLPLLYTVNYPDGRRISFNPANNGDPNFRGGPGISDRFQQLTDMNGGACYLLLPDGGKVWFDAQIDREQDEQTGVVTSTFTYQFMGIIDPYGQTTTVSYPPDGSMQITEPAGRWLKLFYTTTPWMGDTVLVQVQASDGRSVVYNYGPYQPAGAAMYSYLGNVQYRDNNGASYAQAIYAYQQSNTDPNGRPLIYWAIDPMFGGPMWAISYTFVPGSSGGVYGQLQSENYLDPFTGTPGQVVSSLSQNGNSRAETRGDGPSRTFNYNGGKLASYSDFRGIYSFLGYDGNGYVNSVTDRNNHTTTMSREGIIGALSLLTHPDTEHSTQGYAYWYSNGGPYYVQIRGDERSHNTYFTRDSNNFQLTRIDHPDYPNGAYETFSYNGFGQVETHTKSSGGPGSATETLHHDYRGMMWASDNPDGTTYYYYDGNDRLEHVTDPRSNTTWFQYNARGQITRVTHSHDGSFVQYGYNVDGTLAWSADENHPGADTDASQRTRYAYDVYKRVVSVTNPLNQTTSIVYAQDWSNAYNQTTSNPKGVFSPMGKAVHYAYDENWQRTIMRVPPTSDPNSDSNDAWTFYGYDAVGNLLAIQNPRTYVTSFQYDERNRRIWMDDPIASDRNSRGHTMNWDYDTTSNLRFETRADDSYREWQYDSMNRVSDTYGFAREHTHYDRDLAGNVYQMIDAKSAVYGFGYDAMNRKTSATYPPDATNAIRTETWHYDTVGNMDLYKNPADQHRHLFYDGRNRMYDAWWDNSAAPEVVIGYDFASRVTSVVTNTPQTTAETIVVFGYDDANRKIWEDQTPSGYPTRRVNTPPDADGNRMSLDIPNIYHLDYGFNQRNQLSAIGGFANFHYDANGNMTNREGVWGYTNETNFAYDALNRVTQTEFGANGWIYARSHYQYDSLNRQVATWRDEQSSKGERFGYDAMGQLTSVQYNSDQVWTGNPLNATRSVTYTLDALNRQSVNENGTVTEFSPNAINQYTQWSGLSISYDGNFNFSSIAGWQLTYDAENHLTNEAYPGGTQESFVYDGLGRCVKRTVNGSATVYTYDGWKPIVDWDQSGNLLAANIYGAGPDEIVARWDTTYGALIYKQDHHGNVVSLLDGSGNVIEKYTYDAFGKPTVVSWNSASNSWDSSHPESSAYGNRFMFQGREWYSEIELYNFRNRFYNPTFGRFMQPDPLGFGGGDANLFRFCGGDPVNGRDPYGLWTFQLGFQLSGQIGPMSFAWGAGIAFDGHGNVGGYTSSYVGGSGLGADVNLGIGGMNSNADTINGLEGPFAEASFTAGEEGAATVGTFISPDGTVSGSSVFGGLGGGLGATGGISTTSVSNWFNISELFGSSHSPAPAPGGSTYLDPNFDGVTLERVIVRSTYLTTPSLYSFHVDPNTFFSPGYGSGLNSGSQGGASAATVLATIFQTLAGVPGGGGQPGEGFHPVSSDLF